MYSLICRPSALTVGPLRELALSFVLFEVEDSRLGSSKRTRLTSICTPSSVLPFGIDVLFVPRQTTGRWSHAVQSYYAFQLQVCLLKGFLCLRLEGLKAQVFVEVAAVFAVWEGCRLSELGVWAGWPAASTSVRADLLVTACSLKLMVRASGALMVSSLRNSPGVDAV